MKKLLVIMVVILLIVTCFMVVSCNKKGDPNCDHTFVQGKIIKNATCTQDGKVEYVCSKCGATTTRTIPATGHNFVDGICTDCGAHQH